MSKRIPRDKNEHIDCSDVARAIYEMIDMPRIAHTLDIDPSSLTEVVWDFPDTLLRVGNRTFRVVVMEDVRRGSDGEE